MRSCRDRFGRHPPFLFRIPGPVRRRLPRGRLYGQDHGPDNSSESHDVQETKNLRSSPIRRSKFFGHGLRVQFFLRACMDANTREKVDSSILESFGTLRNILMQEFHVTLPAFYLPAPSQPNPTEARAFTPSNAKRPRGNPTADHASTPA
jgi:hypothetical protein